MLRQSRLTGQKTGVDVGTAGVFGLHSGLYGVIVRGKIEPVGLVSLALEFHDAHCHRRRLLKGCPRAAGVFAMFVRRQKPLCSISLFYKCFSEKLYTLIFITFFLQTPLTYGKPAAIMARKARRASCSEKQQPDKRQAETLVSYPFFLEKRRSAAWSF